ncbi:MAG: C69 family dipeptidase [Peptoniphilus sp.]|nr:C69 family dipeptidase [Peptoniphilus sp.]
MKKIISLMLALVMVSTLFTSTIFACTSTYVGDEVSANGSTLVARTEDISGAHPKSFVAYPAQEYKEGTEFIDVLTGFTWPQPKKSLSYIAVPDTAGELDDGIYDEVGYNEKGVAVSATESASYNDGIEAIDPLVDAGLREANITTLVLSQATTAREGVELLAKIVDEKGASEGNTLMIADQEETWYMEILSGHQYAAMKLPTDKAAIMPNCFMLDYVDVDDTENYITSKDLYNLPKSHNLIQTVDGKFSVRKTYGPELSEYNRSRLWGGYNLLAPSMKLSYDAPEEDFKLLFTPDEDVSVKNVMNFQRYRYEGTALDANLPENKDVRAIGVPSQVECHVLELKKDFPKEAPGILWLAVGNAEHNVYVPFFSNLTKTPEAYAKKSLKFDETQAYWRYRALTMLSEMDRERYGKSVREYWSKYEDELLKTQELRNKKFLTLYHQEPAKSVAYANDMAEELGMDALGKAKIMYDELMEYVIANSTRTQKKPFRTSLLD